MARRRARVADRALTPRAKAARPGGLRARRRPARTPHRDRRPSATDAPRRSSAGIAPAGPDRRATTARRPKSTNLGDLAGLLADPDAASGSISRARRGPGQGGRRCPRLHPLIAEDIAERNQRAKVETFDGTSSTSSCSPSHYAGEARASEVDFVLGERLPADRPRRRRWDTSRRRPLRFGVEHALKKGPDFLLYAIADTIVDGYFPVLDKIGDDIDELQDKVIADGVRRGTLQRLFALKRELATSAGDLAGPRDLRPADEPRARRDRRTHIVYFRDVYDHLIRVTDELDNYRDLVVGHARHLRLDRQQRPVADHEAAHRGDGDPGRDRRGRRDLRDERGRAAFAGGEAGGFWLVTRSWSSSRSRRPSFLRRIDWI